MFFGHGSLTLTLHQSVPKTLPFVALPRVLLSDGFNERLQVKQDSTLPTAAMVRDYSPHDRMPRNLTKETRPSSSALAEIGGGLGSRLPVDMEFDTDASFSLLNKTTYDRIAREKPEFAAEIH